MPYAGNAKHELVEKAVIRGHVADYHAQVIVGIASGGKTLQHLRSASHPRYELGDELFVMAIERDVEDRRGREARLLAINQRRVTRDDAGFLQRTNPPPARRG